jgi:sulfate/thiosulfate transport system substrate-binding protein
VIPGLRARRLTSWLPAVFWISLFGFAIWPWVWGKTRAPRTVVFYGFSVLGDTLTHRVLPAFQRDWEMKTGEHVEFATSFAGSGTVTNQLIMGVPAQLALLSLELDAERLVKAGIIEPGSWKRLPHAGVLNQTPFVIVVRPGNPKHNRDFPDLARPGVRVVHPDPLTSGAANWAILAEAADNDDSRHA